MAAKDLLAELATNKTAMDERLENKVWAPCARRAGRRSPLIALYYPH